MSTIIDLLNTETNLCKISSSIKQQWDTDRVLTKTVIESDVAETRKENQTVMTLTLLYFVLYDSSFASNDGNHAPVNRQCKAKNTQTLFASHMPKA